MTIICVGVLASYVGSLLLYKTWYLATGAGCAIALLVASAGAVRVDGLARALLPVLVYFAYLASTALWAADPATVLKWVAIDSIEIPVVGLFYLWALNSSFRTECRSMVALVYVCIPIAVGLQLIDPDATRFGYRAVALGPLVVPFCWVSWGRERSAPALGAIVAVLAVLLISRSRTPLAATLIALLASAWATSRSQWEFVRGGAWAVGVLAVLSVVLLAVPFTRPFLAETVSRLTGQDIELGDTMIEAEPFDQVRWDVFTSAVELLWKHQPLGMGYMNFMVWFEDNFGLEMPLHNSFQTWALEGGVPCLAIVAWILWRYLRSLRLPAAAGDTDAKLEAAALRCAMLATLVIGLFHQPHQAPMMFGMLGMACAFAQRHCEPRYLISRSALFGGVLAR